MDSPELLLLQGQDGLPYGVCSLCQCVFRLVLIGDDNQNHVALEGEFLGHERLAHATATAT